MKDCIHLIGYYISDYNLADFVYEENRYDSDFNTADLFNFCPLCGEELKKQ